jgi:hypothetical protein
VLFAAPDEGMATALVGSLTERGFVAFRVEPEAGLRGEGACPEPLKGWLDVA